MKDYKTIQEVRDCEELSAIEKVKIEYHADQFYGLKLALQSYKEVEIYEGDALDYATDLFNELYDFSDSVAQFIDYKKYADFLLLEEIYQFNDQYLIINAAEIY